MKRTRLQELNFDLISLEGAVIRADNIINKYLFGDEGLKPGKLVSVDRTIRLINLKIEEEKQIKSKLSSPA